MENNIDFNIEQDIRITKYLKGQMTADEETMFEQDLKSDPRLRDNAVATARLLKAMKDVGAKKDSQVIDELKKLDVDGAKETASKAIQNVSKAKKVTFQRKTMVIFSAAASVIICFFLGYRIYDNHSMVTLGNEYISAFPESEFIRGEESNAAKEISLLYSNVKNNQDIEESIAELDPMWQSSRSDEYNEYTEHSLEIGWILANAYVINNDKAKAIEVLKVLEKDAGDGSAMAIEAKELQKKIRKNRFF